jgi:hypothetical protein
VGSVWIMHHLHYNMTPKNITDKISEGEAVYEISGEQTGTCSGENYTAHKVELKDNKLSIPHVDARLCDTLTIINRDDVEHAMYFGTLNEHATYAGELGMVIRAGRNKQIKLTELGTHRYHDHEKTELVGTFTVAP